MFILLKNSSQLSAREIRCRYFPKTACFLSSTCYNESNLIPETEVEKVMKKVGNICGIILAWLLSIVLVVMLTVTPMALSALSLLNANVITDVVIDIFMDMVDREKKADADYQLANLTQTSQITDKLPEDIQEEIPEEIPQTSGGIAGLLEEYLRMPVTAQQVELVMNSNVVREILTIYTGDLTNVLTGKETVSALDTNKIKAIVNDNMDEVVQIVKELKPDITEKDLEELKTAITKVVDERADELVQMIPKPEEIKEMIIEQAPEIGIVLKILEKKNVIAWALVGVIALLCVLIFLCRLSGFRGFRWLAVDMFVGGGINALLGLVLLIGTPVVVKMVPDSALNSVVGNILQAFDLALLVRAGIILVAGGVLLAAYILIKKAKVKKVNEAAVNAVIVNTEE